MIKQSCNYVTRYWFRRGKTGKNIGVFEWLVNLVGCKIYGIKELEASESKKSFVVWCSL